MHASESLPLFFRSMVHLFGAILNDVTISLRKAFCLVLRCLSDVLEGSSFIAVWSVSYFVMLFKFFRRCNVVGETEREKGAKVRIMTD